jgi:hypothetical protein
MMGLTVVLDAHSDENSPGTVPDDFHGFTAAIASQEDSNLMQTQGFLIPTGHVWLFKK